MQFVEQGTIRVGVLQTYKSIECAARRDATEGEGLYKLKGPVVSGRFSTNPKIPAKWFLEDGVQQHHTETTNSIFLLCCANILADINLLKRRFGKYVVKIVSPVALAIEIDHALNGYDGRSGLFLVEGKDVEYNKDGLIVDGRTPDLLTDLSYVQKPEEFSEEKEFRFCIIASPSESRGVGQTHLEIDLGSGRMSYAEMLKPTRSW